MLEFGSFFKKEEKEEKDIGFTEDSISVLLNLVHIELHSINSFFKTNDENWLKINDEARKDRTELLDLIVQNPVAEEWCFSKHSLVTILGYIELGNRKYSEGNIVESKKYFEKASKWLGLFMVTNKL